MKNFNLFFKSFRTKITLILIISMLFAAALSNFLIYRYTLQAQFNQLRDKLMIVAKTATLTIDADLLVKVPLDKEGIKTEEFQEIAKQLNKIKAVNKPIKYIYIMTKTAQDGMWQFVVDPSFSEIVKGRSIYSYPGDKYDVSRFPDMLKAFDGPSADKKLTVDKWGVSLSGYAPIYDRNAKAIAVLGVDIAADDVYIVEQAVHRRALLVLLLGITISLILGFFISRKITKPLKRLVEGTRHIAKGELQYKVQVAGSDEISELAESFNHMADSLRDSQQKLQSYFYRVVQSLVRILEAKDTYVRGHSERVADYSEKIALKMGLSQDKVNMLKEVSFLHDIGKLGIHEDILNKKGKLTPEEWELIRQHPVIGEEILKPVLLDKEMLNIVRGHHERYDGNGYPDKLKGKDINILSQIISVADAYDAMTSARAYRSALSLQEAIKELKNNSGTQFSPEVIEVFVQLYKDNQVY